MRGIPQGGVLGLIFFNIFMNDLFYHFMNIKLHAYANDEQLYDSDTDWISDLSITMTLPTSGTKIMVNPSKHQAMIIVKTDYTFSFPMKRSIDLFGMTVENKFSFDGHISYLCKKISNQFNVTLQFLYPIPD